MTSVCVITPSFNQGRFIERTIQSVLSQKIAGLEYVVFDGGSTDETVDILKRYETKLRWVSEPDKGQAHAVNKGILATSGDIIGWLNSDDIYYPGAIQGILDFLELHPEVDLVYGQADHIDTEDKCIEPYPTEEWDIERLKQVCYLCQPATFFRRRLVDRFGLLDDTLQYCLDYEYWLRVGLGGARVAFLPSKRLAGSRLHAETKTLGSKVKVHREICEMTRARLGRVPDRWLFTYAHVIAEDRELTWEGPRQFASAVSVAAIDTAIKWNQAVSRDMRRTVANWVGSDILWEPMKIGVDVSQTGKSKAGCGYFADSLIRGLAEQDLDHEYLLYPTFGDFYFDPDWERATLQSEWAHVQQGLGHRTFEEASHFWNHPPADFEKQLGSPQIIHANNYYCPTELKKARLVYTLYDLSFLDHPEWTTEQNRAGCFKGVFNASLHADFIIAISNYTRQRFLEVFPYYPPDRVVVVHLASRFSKCADLAQPEGLRFIAPTRFWLNVGTLEPRKNHPRLLKAYAKLKAQPGETMPLVLAGGSGWLIDDLESLIADLNIQQDVIRLYYVNDAELQWLYQNCFALVYPSSLEGFGLPVLEAMGLGAPIITSNTSSLPEVAGSAGILVDPFNEDEIFQAMLKLCLGEASRQTLKELSLERAKMFSWDRAAAEVLEVYRRALSLNTFQDHAFCQQSVNSFERWGSKVIKSSMLSKASL